VAERRIYIRTEPLAHGFDITVEPPPEWTSYNTDRPTHAQALRYAESLKIVHGWRIFDEGGGS